MISRSNLKTEYAHSSFYTGYYIKEYCFFNSFLKAKKNLEIDID